MLKCSKHFCPAFFLSCVQLCPQTLNGLMRSSFPAGHMLPAIQEDSVPFFWGVGTECQLFKGQMLELHFRSADDSLGPPLGRLPSSRPVLLNPYQVLDSSMQ